jgi:lysozyme
MKNELTSATVNLIKQFEGLRLEAYTDSAGIWTIGFGHTKGVYAGMEITDYGAAKLLIDDLGIAAACVARVIKKQMTNHEFGGFVSLTHNIGVGAFEGSTAARKFNKGDKNGASQAILMWNKITVNGKKVVSQGLINRRASEAVYFQMNVADASLPTHFYETTAGSGGAREGVPAAWLPIAALIAAIALFFDEVEAFFAGLF